jgi:phage terminase large subunit
MVEAREIAATWHEAATYNWLKDPAGERVLIHEGGTRSGKTYNICIAWAEYLLEAPGELLSIVRETGPALKATVRRDMIEVLRAFGVYSDEQHNKTDDVISLPNGAVIEFFSTDSDQKVHGRKRDHLWANEANEIPDPIFTQLALRTTRRICLDFNPSMREDHWIWRRYDASQDVRRHRSTYRDNPFLSPEQIREIEALKDQDEWAWQVYGLGLRGVPADSIYRDVHPLAEWPAVDEYVYGLDFGYNDPMTLCRVARRDREGKPDLYVWAMVHESYLTTSDLIARLPALGVNPDAPMYCDAAEPDRIEELQRAGYNALPADKGQGSVRAGIDFVKRHRIHVGGPAGEKARAEWKAYRWKKTRGVIQDDPAHDDSHAPDAGRYAAFTHFAKGDNWLFA